MSSQNWQEEDHPRANDGKFTSGGGGGPVAGAKEAAAAVEAAGEMTSFEALSDYQNYAYGRINELLRGGGELDAKGKAYVKAIDAAFDEAKEQRVRVFRGDGAGLSATLFETYPLPANFPNRVNAHMDPTTLASVDKILQDTYVGKVFYDKAYVSTGSSKSRVLDRFVSGSHEVTRYGAVGLVEITGTSKAIEMDAMTGRRTTERETLLPRTTRMEIKDVNVKYHPDGERVYLHWKVGIVH